MINYKKILLIMPLLLALGIVMMLIMKMMVSMETGTPRDNPINRQLSG